jgi:hypothetical protein
MRVLNMVEILLAAIAQKGLAVKLDGDRPILSGPAEAKTPQVIAVLKEHREEIIRHLKTVSVWVEVLTGSGIVLRSSSWGPGRWPVGAEKWRRLGTESWQSLEG